MYLFFYDEFIYAMGFTDEYKDYSPEKPLPEIMHNTCKRLLIEFMLIGGKPEAKANTKGSMQSMFQFLKEKGYPYGIRCSMERFGTYGNVRVYPLYTILQIVENKTK